MHHIRWLAEFLAATCELMQPRTLVERDLGGGELGGTRILPRLRGMPDQISSARILAADVPIEERTRRRLYSATTSPFDVR